MKQGFIAEVEALRQRPGLTLDHPSMKSVGYRQAWQHLEGDFDRQRMVAALSCGDPTTGQASVDRAAADDDIPLV